MITTNKKYDKRFIAVLVAIAVGLAFYGIAALAQNDGMQPPTQEEISNFFKSLQGVGGKGPAALILVAVQGAMLLVRQFIQGKFKILIVTGLTMIASIISGFVAGQPIMEILLSGGALASLQVFIHQLFTQFKKEELPKV